MIPFTVEEMNLICIYNPGSRLGLLENLAAARPYLDSPELLALADRCAEEVSALSEPEFAALSFEPASPVLFSEHEPEPV